MEQAYEKFGFEEDVLKQALKNSIGGAAWYFRIEKLWRIFAENIQSISRVELVRMHDKQSTASWHDRGQILGVDDTASLLMHWDNGSGLNVIYGEDCVKKIPIVQNCLLWKDRGVVFEGESRRIFLSRQFWEVKGGEQSRYMKIYNELKMGLDFCTDGEDV